MLEKLEKRLTITPEIAALVRDICLEDNGNGKQALVDFKFMTTSVATYGLRYLADIYAMRTDAPRIPKILEQAYLDEDSPMYLYEYVSSDKRRARFGELPWADAEDRLLEWPVYAANYALEVRRGRWPELEELFEANFYQGERGDSVQHCYEAAMTLLEAGRNFDKEAWWDTEGKYLSGKYVRPVPQSV